MTPVSLLPYVVWRIEVNGRGAVAQLGERLICIQEVAGSIPTSSTSSGKRVGSKSERATYPREGKGRKSASGPGL
jgi:hypothetical protein